MAGWPHPARSQRSPECDAGALVGDLNRRVPDDERRLRPDRPGRRRLPGRLPAAFFSRLQAVGIGLPGQRVADLGTGTGTVARGFARLGCAVTGIDPAPALLREAERL